MTAFWISVEKEVGNRVLSFFSTMLIFSVLFFVISLYGCTSVTAYRVKPDDYSTNGIRYWLAMPYLIVRSPVEVSRMENLYKIDIGSSTLKPLEIGPGNNGISAPPSRTSPAQMDDTKKPKAPAGGSKQEAPPKPEPAPPDSTPSGPWSDVINIVWMPDYCQQYALNQSSFLAKLDAVVTLGDGWRLGSLDTKTDSTQLLSKVLEVIGSIQVAKQGGTSQQPPQTSGGPSSAASILGTEVEGKPLVTYLKQSKVTYLKPGLYPIFSRKTKSGQCESVPELDLSKFEFVTADTWSELPIAPKSTQPTKSK